MRKFIAIGIILLFIGLAFTPTVNANTTKEELIEITTEVYGFSCGKQNVKITEERLEELRVSINSIQEKLDKVKSKAEAEKILEETVLELKEYGLMPTGFNFEKIVKSIMNFMPNLKYLSGYSETGIFFNKSNFFNILFCRGDEMIIMNHINLILLLYYYVLLNNNRLPLLRYFIFFIANRSRMRLLGGGLDLRGDSSAVSIGLTGIQKTENNNLSIIIIGFIGLIINSPKLNFAFGFNLMSFYPWIGRP